MGKILNFTLFALICICLSGCDKSDAENDNRLKVVSTTTIVGDMVARVGGDRIMQKTLMGPGVDPHLYKASEGDVRRVGEADIIFYSGLHLEAKMGEVFQKMSNEKSIVAVTRGIPKNSLIVNQEFGEFPDPHIWFDVSLWKLTVNTIRDELINSDLQNKDYYTSNALVFVNELTELDIWVKAEIDKIEPSKRVLITAHDAFNYFGRAYGIKVRGLQGISTAAEAGAKDVDTLAGFIAEKQIPAIFIESSIPKRNIIAVQEAVEGKKFKVSIGGELYSDALGSAGTPTGTYIGMVRHNTETIVNALTGKSERK